LTYELARRLSRTSVTANLLHPGVVSTSFGADDPGRVQRLAVPIMRPFMQAPAQGAATSIHVASAPTLERTTGRYFANRKAKRSSKASYDAATAARLWRVSSDLVVRRGWRERLRAGYGLAAIQRVDCGRSTVQ
jgi:NAD(P)-dependent dehydrogenase (short-subunit alcohol dehydrogenase family)